MGRRKRSDTRRASPTPQVLRGAMHVQACVRGSLGSEQTSASRWKHTKQTSVKVLSDSVDRRPDCFSLWGASHSSQLTGQSKGTPVLRAGCHPVWSQLRLELELLSSELDSPGLGSASRHELSNLWGPGVPPGPLGSGRMSPETWHGAVTPVIPAPQRRRTGPLSPQWLDGLVPSPQHPQAGQYSLSPGTWLHWMVRCRVVMGDACTSPSPERK